MLLCRALHSTGEMIFGSYTYTTTSRDPSRADTVKTYVHFECGTEEFLERAIRRHEGIDNISGMRLMLGSYPECAADLRAAVAGPPREVQPLAGGPMLNFDPPSDVAITAAATGAISPLTAHASTSVAVVEPQPQSATARVQELEGRPEALQGFSLDRLEAALVVVWDIMQASE